MRPDITDQGASAAQPASPVEGNSIPDRALSQECLTAAEELAPPSGEGFEVHMHLEAEIKPLNVLPSSVPLEVSAGEFSEEGILPTEQVGETLVPSPEADSLGGDPPRRSEGPLGGSGGGAADG